MDAETYFKLMKKAETKKLGDSEYRFFSHLCLRSNVKNFTKPTNEMLKNVFGVNERSISRWLTVLEEKGLVNVVYNRHRHERFIYINSVDSNKGFVEPSLEDMSEAQRKFKLRFPDRVVDCEVPIDVDMDRLIREIENSRHLLACTNMSLKSCAIKYYEKIIRGDYRNIETITSSSNFSTGRTYTKEEMNSLFQNIDDIEV